METLQNIDTFLANYLGLTDSEIQTFKQNMDKLILKKKDCFIEQGKRAAIKGFVNRGCTRTYFTDHNGKENIIFFSFEGSWIGDIESYHSNKPSRITIEAIEDSELLVISKNNFELIQKKMPILNQWYEMSAVKMYSSLFDKLIESKIRSPKDRYEFLIEKHPHIFQRIPLKYISDYLEIEPQSLSRLRKRLSKS